MLGSFTRAEALIFTRAEAGAGAGAGAGPGTFLPLMQGGTPSLGVGSCSTPPFRCRRDAPRPPLSSTFSFQLTACGWIASGTSTRGIECGAAWSSADTGLSPLHPRPHQCLSSWAQIPCARCLCHYGHLTHNNVCWAAPKWTPVPQNTGRRAPDGHCASASPAVPPRLRLGHWGLWQAQRRRRRRRPA